MLIFGKRNPHGARNIDADWAELVYHKVASGMPLIRAKWAATEVILRLAASMDVASFNASILNCVPKTDYNLRLVGWANRSGQWIVLSECPTLVKKSILHPLGDLLSFTDLDIYNEAEEKAKADRDERRREIEVALHNSIPRVNRDRRVTGLAQGSEEEVGAR